MKTLRQTRNVRIVGLGVLNATILIKRISATVRNHVKRPAVFAKSYFAEKTWEKKLVDGFSPKQIKITLLSLIISKDTMGTSYSNISLQILLYLKLSIWV
jgi:hypothetical protein